MRAVLPALFCLSTVLAHAQQEPFVPRHQIKFSLLDVLDPIPSSFLFSYEHPIGEDRALILEGGPSVAYNGDRLRGYKFRVEGRRYFSMSDSGDRLYWGLQVRLKNYRRDKTDTFCRDNCNFFQEMDYQLHSRIWAAHLSFGGSIVLDKHIVMDAGIFGGWRWANRMTDLPPDATLAQGAGPFINFERIGRFSTPSVGMVVRVGFGW